MTGSRPGTSKPGTSKPGTSKPGTSKPGTSNSSKKARLTSASKLDPNKQFSDTEEHVRNDEVSGLSTPSKSLHCNMCNNSISDYDDRMQCDCCKNTYHLTCTDLNNDVFLMLAKHNCFDKILWCCFSCKTSANFTLTTDKMSPTQEPTNAVLINMIFELQERVANLELQPERPLISKKQSTIAAVKPPTPDKTTHQVIVSVDENEALTDQTFAQKLKSNLNSVPVTSFKVTKEGQGILNFPDKASRDVGLSKLVNDFKATANNRPQRILMPKITIFGINSSDYKEADRSKLKQAISDKNPTLKPYIDDGKVFDILFIKEDNRREGFSFAAVKVDTAIYSAIQQMNYHLYIDFSRCQVNDRLRITQCYRCQQFGHLSGNCSSQNQVCRYCTDAHSSKNCPVKSNIGKYKCANCKSNHSSTYIACSVLQSQAESLIKRTQGMENMSKNDIRPYAIIT